MNTQKSLAFLYTDIKMSKREIKKTMHLQHHQKQVLRNKFNQRGKISEH